MIRDNTLVVVVFPYYSLTILYCYFTHEHGFFQVNVEGNFTFSGPAMQPLLNVSADGNVTIASVLFFGTEALIAGMLSL
jgi:hypothetical protein